MKWERKTVRKFKKNPSTMKKFTSNKLKDRVKHVHDKCFNQKKYSHDVLIASKNVVWLTSIFYNARVVIFSEFE